MQLNSDDIPITKPINRVDTAANKHDLAYRHNIDLQSQHLANQQMIEELKNISNRTFREKVERAIVIRILQAKIKFGFGFGHKLHKEF